MYKCKFSKRILFVQKKNSGFKIKILGKIDKKFKLKIIKLFLFIFADY